MTELDWASGPSGPHEELSGGGEVRAHRSEVTSAGAGETTFNEMDVR